MVDAKPKAVKKPKQIQVECVRKFFVEDLTSDTLTKQINPGETVMISSVNAKKLQKAGVIMVSIDD